MREWVRGDPVASDGLRHMPPEGACADRQRAKPDIVAISRRADHARPIIQRKVGDGRLQASVTTCTSLGLAVFQATATKVIQTSASHECRGIPRPTSDLSNARMSYPFFNMDNAPQKIQW